MDYAEGARNRKIVGRVAEQGDFNVGGRFGSIEGSGLGEGRKRVGGFGAAFRGATEKTGEKGDFPRFGGLRLGIITGKTEERSFGWFSG